jgi:hypothetical protein
MGACLAFLSGSSDDEKFAGLLLVTRHLQPPSTHVNEVCYACMAHAARKCLTFQKTKQLISDELRVLRQLVELVGRNKHITNSFINPSSMMNTNRELIK